MKRPLPTVFVSYNPRSTFERTLALRLHTLGAVHGYKMYLPDRSQGGTGVSMETKGRIWHSNYFILFSTSKLSKMIEAEIEIAWSHLMDKSRILIIYDKPEGKNLLGTEHCTEIFIDSDKMSLEQIHAKVIGEMTRLNYTAMPPKGTSGKKSGANDDNVIAGLVVAGLGLLLLGALLNNK